MRRQWSLPAGDLFVLLVLLALCAGFVPIASWAEQAQSRVVANVSNPAPVIPIDELFARAPTATDYEISPDGKLLAWTVAEGGKNVVKVRDIESAEVKTLAFERSAFTLRWASDSSRLYFSQRSDGEDNYHLFVVDAKRPGAVATDLTPYPNTTYRWQRIIRDDPNRVLIQINLARRTLFHRVIAVFGIRPADPTLIRDAALFHLYSLDVENGALTLLEENPGDINSWITDKAGRVIGRFRSRDRGWIMEARIGEGPWRQILAGGPDEDFNTLGRASDPRFMWAISNRDRDKSALVRVDLATGAEDVVYQHPRVDVAGAWIDEDRHEPVYAWAWPAYKEIHAFDPELGQELASFRSDESAAITVQSSDRNFSRLVVRIDAAHRSTTHYLFDRSRKTRALLAARSASRATDVLAPMTPVVVPARDGLSLHGYLTVPRGQEGKRIPMVLFVHGGPWSRVFPAFDPWVQMLQSRGFAVLNMNYRGSRGYGRAFVDASKRQFARGMHDDLVDSVRWAVKQSVADPDKVAIMGFDYGGYAALVGLTFTPDVFAAAIDMFGVADLAHLPERLPRSLGRRRVTFPPSYIGDPRRPDDRAEMAARSPINHLDRIARPLLLLEGEKAPREIRAASDRVVAAMREAKLDVEYVLFPDESGALTKRQNRLAAAGHVEAFLGRHLGGRSAGPVTE